MSRKDIKKGIEIQAKADAAREDKIAAGLDVIAAGVKQAQSDVQQIGDHVDFMMKDFAYQEAERHHGLSYPKKHYFDLDETEQRVLSAALYTMKAKKPQCSDLQRRFADTIWRNIPVENNTEFDFATLRNVDSFIDRIVILDVICAFWFLFDCTFDSLSYDQYPWISSLISSSDYSGICKSINDRYSVLGSESFLSHYDRKDVGDNPVNTDSQSPAEEVLPEINADSEFNPLVEIILRHLVGQDGFGKQHKVDQDFLDKEFGKSQPNIAVDAAVVATKVANGFLLFTTHAFYWNIGSPMKKSYYCLPYDTFRDYTTKDGKIPRTRKIIIKYFSEESQASKVELDDHKVSVTKLGDMLVEIKKAIDTGACRTAETDRKISFSGLCKQQLTDFFAILTSMMMEAEYTLTEAYLLACEFGVDDHWNYFVDTIPQAHIDEGIISFVDSVPYPSKPVISEEAIQICMRTLIRSNDIASQDLSTLPRKLENHMKQYVSGTDCLAVLKGEIKNLRTISAHEIDSIVEALPEGLKYYEDIACDLKKLYSKQREEEKRKQNTVPAKAKKELALWGETFRETVSEEFSKSPLARIIAKKPPKGE